MKNGFKKLPKKQVDVAPTKYNKVLHYTIAKEKWKMKIHAQRR